MSSSSSSSVQCQICFKYGHTAAVCFDQNFPPNHSNDPQPQYKYSSPFVTPIPFNDPQPQFPSPFVTPIPFPFNDNDIGIDNTRPMIKFEDLESTRNQTGVALSIAKRLLLKDSKDANKNMVFSPLSLHVVLSILAAGSDGRTLDELLSFLGSNSTDRLNSLASHLVSTVLSDASSSGGPRVCFANSVWVEQSLPLCTSFKQMVTTHYKATLASVDFCTKALEVTNEVNLWAKKQTNGLVKDILPPESVDNLTRLIFANALYFKGAWNQKFYASMTRDCDFHLLNGTPVKVPFMVSKKKQFINAFDGFKVLRLPYKWGEVMRRFSMYFLLPDAKDGLSALVEQVTSTPWFLERAIPHQEVEVSDFRIPKFKIFFEFEASHVLKEIGVVLPFSNRADLSKMMVSHEGLYVSKIFHKSFIEINEEGSEAAAVASIVVPAFGGDFVPKRPTPVDFIADHPFIFLIREDSSETVLFIGQVLNPLA